MKKIDENEKKEIMNILKAIPCLHKLPETEFKMPKSETLFLDPYTPVKKK